MRRYTTFGRAFFFRSRGRGWHLGQKCALRWPTLIRSIGVPQVRQGLPSRPYATK
jgi:hypothetical protein